jgi:uncharacterized membrane protein YfcA
MIEALLIGVVAGLIAGLLGVGGGILFVPALTIGFSLSQVSAEATSLVAIVPVAALGAWRQHSYGNVRPRDGMLIGALSLPGGVAGVALANVLPERALKVSFAVLVLALAAQLAWRALSRGD